MLSEVTTFKAVRLLLFLVTSLLRLIKAQIGGFNM